MPTHIPTASFNGHQLQPRASDVSATYRQLRSRPAMHRQDSAVCIPGSDRAENTIPERQPLTHERHVSQTTSQSSLSIPGPHRHEISDRLTRAIRDFEGLLDQALSLARQGAIPEEIDPAPVRELPNNGRRISTVGSGVISPSFSAPGTAQHQTGPPYEIGESGGPRAAPTSPRRNEASGNHATEPFGREWVDSSRRDDSGAGRDNTTQRRSGKTNGPDSPIAARIPLKGSQDHLQRRESNLAERLSRSEIREYIKAQNRIPLHRRSRSEHSNPLLRSHQIRKSERRAWRETGSNVFELRPSPEATSLLAEDDDSLVDLTFDRGLDTNVKPRQVSQVIDASADLEDLDLQNTRHVDIYGASGKGFSRSYRHQPIARDWHVRRKRFTATVTCINTALLGIIVGIYAGEVPAIQYVVVDLHHWVILGNTCLYAGLALPTLFLWPLPLMHGRKPHTVIALAVTLALQIPQGVTVGAFRSPYNHSFRVLLLLCRGLSGFAMGFAAMNFKTTLLDLFGASLMSSNPHQEVVYDDDVRRHGGGMGVWLGWWSWCTIGPISIGFFIGASIIDEADVVWGFWVSTFCLMFVLLLNIVTPEVRRSAYRRTIADLIKRDGDKVRRVGRGEIKMHLISRGPLWWGEEVKAGVQLSWKMLKQPGLLLLLVYLAWVNAQYTLVLMLLGALTSQSYHYRSVHVGVCIFMMAIGALLATPFQKASFFSRARHHPQRTDSMTFQKRITMSSHMIRRLIFTTLLPLAAIAYTVTARGPPLSAGWPTFMAALVAFLTNLAIAECHGLIMETFDTSDLQAGMTGHKRARLSDHDQKFRTTFSCYPRVTAGFALSQGLGYIFIAAATATCGGLVRQLGAKEATGVVAAILSCLTLALTAALFRFKVTQMIPDRRASMASGRPRKSSEWEPVILGNPSGITRRVSLLELGNLSRWMEIRRRNRLHDPPI